jgi:hypothetical protein
LFWSSETRNKGHSKVNNGASGVRLLTEVSVLGSYIVVPDFAIESGGVHSEQFGGARLMTAGYLQGTPNEFYLEAIHFVVERYSA